MTTRSPKLVARRRGLAAVAIALPVLALMTNGAGGAPSSGMAGGMLFVANQGQFGSPDEILFQFQDGPVTGWLTRDALWFDVAATTPSPVRHFPVAGAGRSLPPRVTRAAALRVTFSGDARAFAVEPIGAPVSRFSYFVGRDASRWARGVPVYAGVRLVGVAEGLDLELGGRGGRFAWRAIAGEPGALERLSLRIEGAAALPRVGQALRIETEAGTLVLPAIESDGSRPGTTARPAADGSFTLAPPMAPRPAAMADDPARPGELLFGGFLGGQRWDNLVDMHVVDDTVYVAGVTQSPDFPATPGAHDGACRADYCWDGFVARLESTGTRLEFATYLGGDQGGDAVYGVAVSGDGGVFLTGSTTSTDFPATARAPQRAFGGDACGALATGYVCSDAFVVRLDDQGTRLGYATYLGGDAMDEAEDIVVDASGNAFVTGMTTSDRFPVSANALDSSWGGGACTVTFGARCPDGFLAKINADGSELAYGTYLGGADGDYLYAVLLDPSDRPIVAGGSSSIDYPVSGNALQRELKRGECRYEITGPLVPCDDVVITQLRPDLSGLAYSTYLGGTAGESAAAMTLGSDGSVYLTGTTGSPDYPVTANAANSTKGGEFDAFITKLQPTLRLQSYGTFMGGPRLDYGSDIAVGGSGQVYLALRTNSTLFTISPIRGFDTTQNGDYDAAVLRLDRAGLRIDYQSFLGGANYDSAAAIEVNEAGSAYIAGQTYSADFPFRPASFDDSFAVATCGTEPDTYPCPEGYVVKLAFDAVPTATPTGPAASATPTPTEEPPATDVPSPTTTPDLVATIVAATLTARAPTVASTMTVTPTPDRLQTAVAGTLTAAAPPPDRWRVYLPWAVRTGSP